MKRVILLSCALLCGKAHAWDVFDVIDKAKDGIDAVKDGIDIYDRFIGEDGDQDDSSVTMSQPDGFESSLNGEIDDFFKTFNHSGDDAEEETPIGVHDLGSKECSLPKPLFHPHSHRVSLPSSKGNAESIDFITGGNRAANSEEMETALGSIKGGKAYAHLLSQETVSPLVSSAFKQIQTWANQINAINVYSSEMAAAHASGPLPRKQRSKAYLAEKALVNDANIKDVTDMIEARTYRLKKPVKSNPINVAATLLSGLGLKDDFRRQLFLNITGTIVSKGETIDTYPPLHRQILALLQSGKPLNNAYTSDNKQGSLKPAEKSEKDKISELFNGIQKKLKTDDLLSKNEADLLEKTSFPIGSWITLMTQYKGNGAEIALDRYADLMAYERAMQFVSEAAREMLHAAQSLRASQVDSYETDIYINQVQEVLNDLTAMNNEHYQKMAAEDRALEHMIRLDDKLRNSEKGL